MKLSKYFQGDGLSARAARGSALMVVNFAGQNIIRLASNLILTRLLFPEAFGLMALVSVVLQGLALFSDFGFRDSVVQDERGEETDFLNTTWTMQILRGLVLGLLAALLAYPTASFYGEPLLGDILLFSAIIPVLQGLNSTNILTADRQLLLGRLTVLMLGTQIVGLLITIGLAWWLQSVWALPIGNVITVAALAGFSHLALPGIRNRWFIEWDAVLRLFTFGKYIFFSTLAMFFIQQMDKVVLGKYVTLEDLAIYNIAYLFASMPLLFALTLNERVIYPLYARKPPKEGEQNRRKINKARFLLTPGLLIGTAVLALIGVKMIEILYDNRYWAAGPILSLVAICTFPRLIVQSYEKLPLATGDARNFAIVRILYAVIQTLLLLAGVHYLGLLGAILAPAAAVFLIYPPLILLTRAHKGWDPLHDAVFLVLALGLSAGLLWFHWAAFTPLLDAAGL